MVKFKKIIETCIYTLDLIKLKDFYVNALGLEFVSEEENRSVFLKAGKSMLLIFNPKSTLDISMDSSQTGNNKVSHADLFPTHGAFTLPSVIHFALEIDSSEYDELKKILLYNNVEIEKELVWNNEMSKSVYFRDPSGNLVEIIVGSNLWPVED